MNHWNRGRDGLCTDYKTTDWLAAIDMVVAVYQDTRQGVELETS